MNEFEPNGNSSYVPTTSTNSTMNIGKWMVPENAVAGDIYRIILSVTFNGFDDSSTSGTFDIYFQGSVYNKTEAAWQWAGNNPVTTTLNNTKSLKTIVLSATSGSYLYETTFSLPQANVNTYTGMNIGVRSNYSNGTGKLTLTNMKVIPEKYATTLTPPSYSIRIGENHIASNNFYEI
jgi:hypothetical protein